MPEPKVLTPPNTEGAEGAENLDAEGNPIVEAEPKVEPTIDWEAETNPYKKRYGDSQGQIQPLVRTLTQFAEYDHNTKTWKPKTQAPAQVPQGASDEEIDKLLDGYDPEFRKIMVKIVSPLKKEVSDLRKYRDDSAFMSEYNSARDAARSSVMQEFGGEFDLVKDGKWNTESPLYKLSNEILCAKYSQFNPDGSFFRYTTAEAEYLSTVEAYAIISKRAKQTPANTNDKGKLGAIQGKGSKSAGAKKVLSYEEYSKLSDEAKDTYDSQQVG